MISTAGLDPHEAFTRVGLCVLFGIFVFIIVEMLASAGAEAGAATQHTNAANETGKCTTTTVHNNNTQRYTSLQHQPNGKAKISSSSVRSNTSNNNTNSSNSNTSNNNCINNNNINTELSTKKYLKDDLHFMEVERKIEVRHFRGSHCYLER